MGTVIPMLSLEREAGEVYAAALRAGASEQEAAERALKLCRDRQPGLSDFELRSAVARAIAASRLDRRKQGGIAPQGRSKEA